MSEFYTNCAIAKNNILYRGYQYGVRVHDKIEYKPSLFIPTNKPSKYKTIDGKVVDRLQFASIYEAKDFIEKYKDINNFQVYGNSNFQYCYLADKFSNKISYDFKTLKILNFDIETTYDSGFPKHTNPVEEIIAITLKCDGKYYVYGCKPYTENIPNGYYIKCDNEQDLLKRFMRKWRELDPDILTGYNINGFDIPYLIKRIERIFGEDESKKLSPWKFIRNRTVKILGKETEYFEFVGITTLDYLEMYKKFIGQAENYKLDTIATIELGEGKMEYHTSLRDLYNNDFTNFIKYNIKDVDLVDRLEEKLGLIKMICNIAYDAKGNIIDLFSQVRLWDTIIFNYFKERNLVVPPNLRTDKKEKFPGGFVKEPQVGLHNWVVSFDLDSLYPSLIRQFNISPETLLDGYQDLTIEKLLNKEYDFSFAKEKGCSVAANGHCFSNTKEGFLGKILMEMLNDRNNFKKRMLSGEAELERINLEMQKRAVG